MHGDGLYSIHGLIARQLAARRASFESGALPRGSRKHNSMYIWKLSYLSQRAGGDRE
jgi:hypothetical protein